jgi:hypothetical protein
MSIYIYMYVYICIIIRPSTLSPPQEPAHDPSVPIAFKPRPRPAVPSTESNAPTVRKVGTWRAERRAGDEAGAGEGEGGDGLLHQEASRMSESVRTGQSEGGEYRGVIARGARQFRKRPTKSDDE